MQDEIAQAIASALQVTLAGTAAPFMQYKPSLPAYEALLKARHYRGLIRPELLPRARECFEQAIALDPKFVLAHCEYGIYFMMMVVLGLVAPNEGWSMVRSQAQKALDLDPSLPEGHAMLGAVAGSLEYDWKEAERQFRLAIAHDPVPVNVRLYYSLHLMKIGRPAEAVQQAELGLQEDPLNHSSPNQSGVVSRRGWPRRGRCRGISRDSGTQSVHGARAIQPGRPTCVARRVGSRAAPLRRGVRACAPPPSGWIARRGAEAHWRYAPGRPNAPQLQPADAFGVPLGLAIYHWVLHEFDAEADWFEKAIDQRDPISSMLLRFWYGAELRTTPRWAG